MVLVDYNRFDQITMLAPAIKAGRAIKVRMTYALGPELSCYNETDKCWEGQWSFRFEYAS